MNVFRMALLLHGLLFNAAVPIMNEVTLPELRSMYTVSVKARNVAFELRVNDIPVLTNDNDASTALSGYPINPWLIGGRNTVSIRILPVENSTTDPDDPKYCRVVVSGPKDGGKPGIALASVEVKPPTTPGPHRSSSKEESFSVVLGHPAPAWATSAKIGKDAATQKLILDRYREFHRLLEKKDLDGVMQFSAAKFKEFSQALDDPTFASSRSESFREQFATPGRLIDIDEQAKNGLRFEYYFGDRLVSIKNDEDDSIIQFLGSEDGMRTVHTLFFYFDGKGFVLIR